MSCYPENILRQLRTVAVYKHGVLHEIACDGHTPIREATAAEYVSQDGHTDESRMMALAEVARAMRSDKETYFYDIG